MLEFLFNKVAGLQTCNFIKKRLRHRCFTVNVPKLLITSILNSIRRFLINTLLMSSKVMPKLVLVITSLRGKFGIN